MSVSEILRQATDRQRLAADPLASVWVGANAGTGKTKVLTDRVLNLLLTGTRPEKILCLTFTKAAAAEMANRLARRLSDWAVASDEALSQDLTTLRGQKPDAVTLRTARRLFAGVLDVPGGMKIQTIHSFCQALLGRFPLEAGISPHFTLIEDRDAAELMRQVREQVLIDARLGANARLSAALSVITRHVQEDSFSSLMIAVSQARGKLRRVLADGVDTAVDRLRQALELESGTTPAGLIAAACHPPRLDEESARALAQALGQGGKSDQELAGVLAAWLALPVEDRAVQWDRYVSVYLTKEKEPKSQTRFPSKAVKEGFPHLLTFLDAETERVYRVEQQAKAAVCLEATGALLVLADAILSRYEQAKATTGRMDFDDLILTARRLLSRSDAAAWVLFKLDGGLDHLMIDEAQDTSPDQWAVVRSLVSEFFAGEGQHPDQPPRTVFAVGDRKQSIYSFQGASPQEFEISRKRFSGAAASIERRFEDVALEVSFRSVPAVLDLVDSVFRRAGAGDGVIGADGIAHLPFRTGQAGVVEVWSPLEPTAAEPAQPWKPPVERIRVESAQNRLARLMAARIEAMIRDQERLDSRDRPIRPGDILILVRRRNGFVDSLVRSLKERGVPVAGVDRMILTEQLVVQDLLALAQVLLLPEDDLTLATVLKGPLFSLSEEDLFTLAHDRRRGVTLWRALRERADHGGPFRDAYQTLRRLMEKADFLPPHELFSHVLGPLQGRKKLLARLGPDAADPLDEFIGLTLAYDRSHPPTLQGFLHWLSADEQQLKRDLEEGGNAVRVMTVHGSKGLQAPVVFLPDTCQIPKNSETLLWQETDEETLLVWPPRAEFRAPLAQALHDENGRRQMQEYRRLLYVALTRAEDRLYVCGWDNRTRRSPDCWHDLVSAAMTDLGQEVDDPLLTRLAGEDPITVWRHTSAQTDPARPDRPVTQNRGDAAALPGWIIAPPPKEPTPSRPLAPSKPVLIDPPVRSPLSGDEDSDSHRFQRGRLIHTLLQILPDLPPEQREAAAARYLARPVWDLPADRQDQFWRETMAVVAHPDFADLFGPGSLAEVPLTGVVAHQHVVSGQVDRLLVRPEGVWVVDFKTNRPPPRRVEDVADAYLVQLALYRDVLQQVYPDRPVHCALLWTDGPFLMDLPPQALDQALSDLLEGRFTAAG